MAAKLKITLLKSVIGSQDYQRQTVLSLGIRKIRQSTVREDNPALRGMIHTVRHLVKVETIEE